MEGYCPDRAMQTLARGKKEAADVGLEGTLLFLAFEKEANVLGRGMVFESSNCCGRQWGM